MCYKNLPNLPSYCQFKKYLKINLFTTNKKILPPNYFLITAENGKICIC